MSPLSIYLWKEWREQRATLGVLAAVLCAGVAAVAAAMPRKLAGDPLALQGAVVIALLATVMSVGSDLLARERSGGGLGFLERLPAGLATAFRAKLVFLALALGAAALYGALLATAASLVRTGDLPHGLLDGTAPWLLAVVAGVSLWVFAVSAWMPASALTFPGTLLLLAAFAWPAALAVKGDPLFRPTPYQGLVFALLCVAGAPLSAWAAFVVGSRLGRTRGRAALAGLAIAGMFFAPSWAWAAGRYASLLNAPFEIQTGWVGPNGRFAFLDLTRRPPHGAAEDTARRWERSTALVVDLEQGSWRFAGEVDASAFMRASAIRRRRHLPEDEIREPLRLLSGEGAWHAESPEILFDPLTARTLGPDELSVGPRPRIGPTDFGLIAAPKAYDIHPAGLGQRLRYRDGGRSVELYRDADGRDVVDAASLPAGEYGRALFDVRVRQGRWLARDVRRWMWLDPSTGEHGPLEHVRRDDWVSQLLDDGRLVLVSAAGVALLDPDSGERAPLRVLGDPRFEIRSLYDGAGLAWSPPLPTAAPAVVLVSSRKETRLALLDVRAGTLELGESSGGCRLHLLWSRAPVAIVLEDGARLVRYDVTGRKREVLFAVDALR